MSTTLETTRPTSLQAAELDRLQAVTRQMIDELQQIPAAAVMNFWDFAGWHDTIHPVDALVALEMICHRQGELTSQRRQEATVAHIEMDLWSHPATVGRLEHRFGSAWMQHLAMLRAIHDADDTHLLEFWQQSTTGNDQTNMMLDLMEIKDGDHDLNVAERVHLIVGQRRDIPADGLVTAAWAIFAARAALQGHDGNYLTRKMIDAWESSVGTIPSASK